MTISTQELSQLIDREIFFGNPEILGAQISPDGRFMAFIKPLDEVRNIWVKEMGEPFENAKPLTDEKKRPIPGFFWSRDSRFILFVKDKDGDEDFNVYAVDPDSEPTAGRPVPDSINLTNAEKVQTQIYALPKTEPDFIYIGINDRDEAWHDLYKVRISTGEKQLLRENTDRFRGWVFDNEGALRLAVRAAANGDTEILRVEGDSFTKIYSGNVFETALPIRFHRHNRLVYLQTNTGDRDRTQLVLFDPETLEETPVEEDPLKRVDLKSTLFSELTDELIVTVYEDEKLRIYWKDPEFEADYQWLKEQLPGMEISLDSLTRDEKIWVITAFSDTEPGRTYLFDRDKKELDFQYRIREKLPRHALSEMKPITYKSSDGLEIPAYLTLPKDFQPKGLPLLVIPHGGPWHRDSWGYNPLAQFFANRGYAVLQMNFRGSTGYGKKFLDAGNGQWGDLMQDDITWGVKYLVDQGIADPKRVGILGGSYGGYATLAGVTFTPDLYAGAVAIVAPSNLITLLNSIPPYWETYRKVFLERMGDPENPEGREKMERQSPLNHADKIKTPLMVVQGANDPRVKKAESDQIVIALRERNYPVVYLLAEDEGHGFQRPVNNMAMYAESEKFLAKHLGGRFQEEMKPEVENRLRELMVDVETVEMPKKYDPADYSTPQPEVDLKPGKSSYEASISLGDQNIPMNVTSQISEDQDGWAITENVQTPRGEMREMSVLEKGALKLKKRSFEQTGIKVFYEIKGNRAVGQMVVNDAEKPLEKELGDENFADGTGSFYVIATLPLKVGYSASYTNFEVQTDTVKRMFLKVTDEEIVEIPFGRFEAWKISLTSDQGDETTVWIDRKDRRVLKIKSILKEMGGAVFTSRLTA
ncbi:MAG: prolyl oligopeptidase family serine peptidase [Pyrinomonadaceae bacterium]